MLKHINKFIFVPFVLNSCSDVIEPSLNKESLTLLSPVNNETSYNYTQTFWWENLNNAINYNLQIVSPSFDKINLLILDSNITANKFTYSFLPGKYQWRIRAQNGSSQTAYTIQNLTIVEATLNNQKLQLRSPLNNAITNTPSPILNWIPLFGAQKYWLQVDTMSNLDEGDSLKMIYNGYVSGSSKQLFLRKDQDYKWRVKAMNDMESSYWSSTFSLTFDQSPPLKVTLKSPINNAINQSTIPTLQWMEIPDAQSYEVKVANSSGTEIFPAANTSFKYLKGKTKDNIRWQVRAIDAAGNIGEYSDLSAFTIE